MINMKTNPFFLDDEGVAWVEDTLASMTVEEKVGQLFCLIQRSDEDWRGEADYVLGFQPGGTQFRPLKGEVAWTVANYYQGKSKVPLLIAANLERGGSGIVKEGTNYACNLQVAATGDVNSATRQGLISAREARAVGGNWAFSPCVDVDYNWRNPITNLRTYGSHPEQVEAMGLAFTTAIQGLGVAASVKHFPGDGLDERDQHLVTTVNDMSVDRWDQTYGRIYRTMIDGGALTIMPGHIALPEYSRKLVPGIADEDILPATLAPELLQGLLRDQLGFNGMIVSDATTMVGMMIPMARRKAVPQIIAAGCDMFLFARNLEEDYGYMMAGVEEGVITPERLDEAVTRILATKAAIGLHTQQAQHTLVPPSSGLDVIGNDEHLEWARECADQAVTLVKSDGTIPIAPQAGKKLLLHVLGDEEGNFALSSGNSGYFKERLEAEGFEVDIFAPEQGMELFLGRFDEVEESYSHIVYFAALATKSNQSTIRIEWAPPIGANAPKFVASVPTIFISLENPYHLLDVPRVKTFINAYTNTRENVDAIVDKLVGRSEFTGVSPVDPFCGKWDTRL